MAAVYITRQGEMLDEIAWRHYGYHAGTVEAILDANYGLADLPHVLPIGTRIVLPDLPPASSRLPQPVRLWD